MKAWTRLGTTSDTKYAEHNFKWDGINMALLRLGYSVDWTRVPDREGCKYRIVKHGNPIHYKSREVLGIFDNEEEAHAMCKLLISNAKYEEG
jgi:hypothetical protein